MHDMRVIYLQLPVGERWVNPLPDEASQAKWENFNKGEKLNFNPLVIITPLQYLLPPVPFGTQIFLYLAKPITTAVEKVKGLFQPLFENTDESFQLQF